MDMLIISAHEDATLRGELMAHLAPLERENMVRTWHDGLFVPGENRSRRLEDQFAQAQIILALVSSDFVASDACYNQLQAAMRRQAEGTVRVIPIIARACNWKVLEFSQLAVLPNNAKAVTSWANRDEAWEDVSTGVRNVLKCDSERAIRETARDSLGTTNGALSLPVGPGLLDHRETLENQTEIMTVVGERIAETMAIFNRQTRDSKLLIATMRDQDLARLSTKQRKRIVNGYASQMAQMAAMLRAELPAFSVAIDEGFGAMSGIAHLLSGAAATSEDLEENAKVLAGYRDALNKTIESLGEYRANYSLLPNLTQELNAARIQATTVLGRLIEKLSDGLRVTEDALAATDVLLEAEM